MEGEESGQAGGPGLGGEWGDKGSQGTIPALSGLQGAAQGGPGPLAGSSLGLLYTASLSSVTQHPCADWLEQARGPSQDVAVVWSPTPPQSSAPQLQVLPGVKDSSALGWAEESKSPDFDGFQKSLTMLCCLVALSAR